MLRFFFIELIEVKIIFFRQSNTAKEAERWSVGTIEYLKTGYPFKNHKKYARSGNLFLIFSAFVVLIGVPFYCIIYIWVSQPCAPPPVSF